MTGWRKRGGVCLLSCAMCLSTCGTRPTSGDAPGPAVPPVPAAACLAGAADCNGRADDGCETKLLEDPAHCGACGNACAVGPQALPVCVDGRCSRACRVGYGECDGDPSTECETQTLRDPCHCGGCGAACPESSFCVAGLCQGRPDPLIEIGPPAPAYCPSASPPPSRGAAGRSWM